MLFKPWEERNRSAHELQQDLQEKWSKIAGGAVFAFQLPPLPGSQGAADAVRHQRPPSRSRT